MKRLNAVRLLDESRKIVSLIVLSFLSAGAVIWLDRLGGPLAAILGSVSVALAARLLYLAASQPDAPTAEGAATGQQIVEPNRDATQTQTSTKRPATDEPLFQGFLTEL